MKDKSFRDFLVNLKKLTQDNIDFIDGKNINFSWHSSLYFEEIKQVQDLINTFCFNIGK